MFSILKKWFGKTKSEEVVITQEQAQVIIGSLIENLENQEEEYLNHIMNLELMVKSIVLINSGNLTVPRDILEMLGNGEYDLQTNEGENGDLELTLEEHHCEHCDGDESGDCEDE